MDACDDIEVIEHTVRAMRYLSPAVNHFLKAMQLRNGKTSIDIRKLLTDSRNEALPLIDLNRKFPRCQPLYVYG